MNIRHIIQSSMLPLIMQICYILDFIRKLFTRDTASKIFIKTVEKKFCPTYDSGNVEKLTEDTTFWRLCARITSNMSTACTIQLVNIT